MTEERLKEIKDKLNTEVISCKNIEEYEMIHELYNEVVRLREENEKIRKQNLYEHKYGSDMENKYIVEKAKNDKAIEYIEHNTFQDSDGGWIFTFYEGKEILLDILNKSNLTLEQLTGVENE